MSSLFKKLLPLVFFAFGLWLLFKTIEKTDPQKIFELIYGLKWSLVIILLYPLLWYFFQALAWYRILVIKKNKVRFQDIFLTKLTGEVVNNVMPINFLGGDPYRIYLLKNKLAVSSTTISVIIDRTIQMISVLALLVLGLMFATIFLPVSGGWRYGLYAFTFLLIALSFLLVFLQKKGLLTLMTQVLKKLGIQRQNLLKLTETITNIDHQVGSFYSNNKMGFFEIFFYNLFARFIGIVEIYIIAKCLGLPLSFINTLLVGVLTMVINLVFGFIPMGVGVLEGSYAGLFSLIGKNPAHGVVIQLVRRIRMFFWIAIGLVIILLYRPQKKHWV